MSKVRSFGRIIRSVSVSPEYDEKARTNDISLSEAVRVGISILLAEKGIVEYDNSLNIYRKMRQYQGEMSAKAGEIELLKGEIVNLQAELGQRKEHF